MNRKFLSKKVLPAVKLAWIPVEVRNKFNAFDISDKKLSVAMTCTNWKLKCI